MYRLYVLENIRRGREDAAQGKTIPAEALLRDIGDLKPGDITQEAL